MTLQKKKCLNPQCQKLFTPKRGQKYCSRSCRRYYYRHYELKRACVGPPLYDFICKKCGKHVYVYKGDKRTDFCNPYCEHLFYKHKKHVPTNNGMSGPMSLGSLIRREARDLW